MMVRRFTLTLFFALMISAAAISAQCKIVYVKTDGNDANSGLDWASAKKTITAGFNAATSGDEVWVAKGTYLGCITPKAGVGLFGGFTGTEANRSERNWTNNVTIIDGSRAGTVVRVPDNAASTTVIDGFTITNGKAINGISGGGILCNNYASPIIANCIIKNNACYAYKYLSAEGWAYSGGYGAGIYSTNYSNPQIINCVIKDNFRYTDAAVSDGISCITHGNVSMTNDVLCDMFYMAALSYGSISGCQFNNAIKIDRSTATITNGTITSNASFENYASVTLNNNTIKGSINCNGCSPIIVNNKFIGTSDSLQPNGIVINGSGGSALIANNIISRYPQSAIYFEGSMSSLKIINNTIFANGASTKQAAICSTTSGTSAVNYIIANNIIAFNAAGIAITKTVPVLQNNCVYNPGGVNYSGAAPGDGDISVDPMFVSLQFSQVHLKPGSPCINNGEDVYVEHDRMDYDIDGQSRIFGSHVDMGADEYQPIITELKDSKFYENNENIQFSGAVVTAAFDGFFYIESDNRETGIRVDKANHGLSIGQKADVAGVLTTNADGERCIAATSALAIDTGSVKPLALTCKALGGGDWLFNSDTGTGQQGIAGVFGLNNIGLLVRLSGGFIKTSDTTFTIDDGSGAVKCVVPAGVTLNPDWKYVTVTGISSCEKVNSSIQRLLRVREQNDIVPQLVQ